MAEFQVKTGGGNGLVARYGDGILFVPVANARSNDLVSVFRFADSDEVFDLVAAYVVDVDFEAPAFALIVVSDEQVQMRVFGDLEMITDFPSVPMISGRGSRTWVDHTAALTGGSFLHAGVAPDPRTDLVTGVVIGGGVQLVIGGEVSEAAPVATIAFDDPPVEADPVLDREPEAPSLPEAEPVLEPEPVLEAQPVFDVEPLTADPILSGDAVAGLSEAPEEQEELSSRPPVSPFSTNPDEAISSGTELPPAPTADSFVASEMTSEDHLAAASSEVPADRVAPFTPVEEPEASMFVMESGDNPSERSEAEGASEQTVDTIMAQIGTDDWAGGAEETIDAQALVGEAPAGADHLPGWASAGIAPSVESQMPSAMAPVSQVGTVDPPSVGYGPESGLPDLPPMPPAPDSFEPPADWSDRRVNDDDTLSPLSPAPGASGERRTAYVLRLDDGSLIPVDSPLVFGRRPSTEGDQKAIKLRGDHVSRNHLLVQMSGGSLTITDTGSRNGSAVIPLTTNTPQPLDGEAYVASSGDRVFFGSRSFVVERSSD